MMKILRKGVILLVIFVAVVAGTSFLMNSQSTDNRSDMNDYLENGNIKNSVNYPNCDMGTCVAVGRISLAHSNTPNMISQVTKILGSEGLNIADMTNKSKGEFAYTLIDLESAASAKALDELKEIEGMYRVRVVK